MGLLMLGLWVAGAGSLPFHHITLSPCLTPDSGPHPLPPFHLCFISLCNQDNLWYLWSPSAHPSYTHTCWVIVHIPLPGGPLICIRFIPLEANCSTARALGNLTFVLTRTVTDWTVRTENRWPTWVCFVVVPCPCLVIHTMSTAVLFRLCHPRWRIMILETNVWPVHSLLFSMYKTCFSM